MSSCECGSGSGPEATGVADSAARATCPATCPRGEPAGVDRRYHRFEIGLLGQVGVQAL